MDSSRLAFLGAPGLARLRHARVAVIGAGGGGSHIAQQFAHLSAGEVFIIDPDDIEESNVNRLVGATYDDVGHPKAEVIAKRFAGLGTRLTAITARVEAIEVRNILETADLVFGAVDRFRARDNAERICRKALVPYIDIGLTIVVNSVGAVQAVGGQIATSVAGGPCLRCLGIVTDANIANDREEYVIGDPQPQVVSMNGLLASQAVNNGIAFLTRYTGHFAVPVHLLYDGLQHSLVANQFFPRDPCPHYPLEDSGWKVVLSTGEKVA